MLFIFIFMSDCCMFQNISKVIVSTEQTKKQTRRSRWCAENHRGLMLKFRGGHLGLWRAFLNQFWPNLVHTHKNSLLNKFCSLRSIQMSIFLELFQKNQYLTIYIHISKGRNSVKNCSIGHIFFYRFRTFQWSFFF